MFKINKINNFINCIVIFGFLLPIFIEILTWLISGNGNFQNNLSLWYLFFKNFNHNYYVLSLLNSLPFVFVGALIQSTSKKLKAQNIYDCLNFKIIGVSSIVLFYCIWFNAIYSISIFQNYNYENSVNSSTNVIVYFTFPFYTLLLIMISGIIEYGFFKDRNK